MTKNETTRLLGILQTAYPYFYKNITVAEAKNASNLWHDMLKGLTLEVAKLALYKLIALHKDYPPTIAHLLESVADVTKEPTPTIADAWAEVKVAISKYGYPRPEEALQSLSPTTAKAVRAMGWLELCSSENEVADRAHFMKIYSTMEKRQKEQNILPLDLQDDMNRLRLIEKNKVLKEDKPRFIEAQPEPLNQAQPEQIGVIFESIRAEMSGISK